MRVTNAISPAYRLKRLEKILLLIPSAGGLVFGLAPLLIPETFAHLSGASGDDPYIYRLSGAAAFGYAVAVLLALSQDDWLPVRLLVIAILTFNLGSVYACVAQIFFSEKQLFVVYVILLASIIIIAITLWLLNRHRGAPSPVPNVANWLVRYLQVITVVAAAVGLLFLLAPVQVARFFGYQGTDDFLYRQGGAATLGYAVMGIFELRSRVWEELRWPIVMALAFNGISFIVTLLAILAGERSLFPFIIAVVSLPVSIGAIIALQRRGG